MLPSFINADGFNRLDLDLIAAEVTAQKVEPKMVWNPKTGKREQKTSRRGIPQWIVYVLLTPFPHDFSHVPEVVPVILTAEAQPQVQSGAPIEFTGFGAWYYTRPDAENPSRIHICRSFMAAGFTQNADDEPEGF